MKKQGLVVALTIGIMLAASAVVQGQNRKPPGFEFLSGHKPVRTERDLEPEPDSRLIPGATWTYTMWTYTFRADYPKLVNRAKSELKLHRFGHESIETGIAHFFRDDGSHGEVVQILAGYRAPKKGILERQKGWVVVSITLNDPPHKKTTRGKKG